MKTKIISMTIAAIMGIGGATSAFAQNINYDSNEWIETLISNSTSVSKHKGYSGENSSSTEIGKSLDTYGKTLPAKGADKAR